MKNILKDAAILFIITVISGALLGLVYQITKEPIAAQEEKAKTEAYKEVFKNATEFKDIESNSELSIINMTEYVKQQGYDVAINNVSEAYDDQQSLLGYVFTVTDHEGYGGDIQFTMGLTMDGNLNGISILSISETAGLGMRAEEVLKPQFENKKAVLFEYTKTGATAENQIDAISGATITTNAVTNGVNAGISCFQQYFITEGGQINE